MAKSCRDGNQIFAIKQLAFLVLATAQNGGDVGGSGIGEVGWEGVPVADLWV